MAFTIKAIRGLLELEDKWTAKLTEAANKTTAFASMTDKQLEDVGRKMTAGGATLTAAVTLPIVGVAAASLKMANDFEGVMNRVEAAMGKPDPATMHQLRQAAQDMGAATVFSSTEAAEALIELGKAGFNSQKSIAALPSVLQLAVAGQLSMSEAATMAANTMATFGIGADKMSKANDIVAKAAASSTISVRDLSETFKYVGPVASTVGVSLEEVAAAAALLGSNGIKADMAGTALRGIMTELMAPTEKQAGIMKRLGLETAFSEGKMMSLVDMLKILEGQGEISAEVMSLFGARAGPAMLALLKQGSGALDEMNVKLQQSDGYAQMVADTYMKGLPGALERAKGSIETAGVALGSLLVPALTAVANTTEKVANFVTNYVIPAFAAMPMPLQVAIGVLAAVAAAIGPIVMAIGLFASGIATLMPLIAWMGGAAGIAAILNPIGLVVAAVVGLTTAWSLWGDDIVRIVSTTYTAVKEWLVDKWEGSIFQSIARMLESIAKLWWALHEKVFEVVVKIATAIALYLVDKLKPVIDFVAPFVTGMITAWTKADTAITATVTRIYTAVKTWLVDKFEAIVASVKAKIDAVTGFFNNMYDKVVGRSYVPDMIEGIASEFAKLDTIMVKPAQLATMATNQIFQTFSGEVAGMFGSFSNQMGGFMNGLVGSLGGGMQGLTGYLKGSADSMTKEFLGTMLSFIPGVGPIVSKLAGPIVDGVKKLFGGVFSGNETKKMFTDAFGNLDEFHKKLGMLGDKGEEFWVKMTQKTGKTDKQAATRLINEIQEALSGMVGKTETEMNDTGQDIEANTQKLHDKIKVILGRGIKIPYSYEAQNAPPGSPGTEAPETAQTATPSGTNEVTSNGSSGRPAIITMNIDGRTAARTVLPYLPDEVELNTA